MSQSINGKREVSHSTTVTDRNRISIAVLFISEMILCSQTLTPL